MKRTRAAGGEHRPKPAESDSKRLAGPPPGGFGSLKPYLGHMIWRAALAMRHRLESGMQPLGLRAPHFVFLSVLNEVGEPISQQAMAARIGIDPSTALAIVDELETMCAVHRQRDPKDRRAYRLHLTAEGQRRLRQAYDVAHEVDASMLAPLTAAERERIKALLQKMLSA